MVLSSVSSETQLIRSDHSDIHTEQLKSFISALSTEQASGQRPGSGYNKDEWPWEVLHRFNTRLHTFVLCMVLESWFNAKWSTFIERGVAAFMLLYNSYEFVLLWNSLMVIIGSFQTYSEIVVNVRKCVVFQSCQLPRCSCVKWFIIQVPCVCSESFIWKSDTQFSSLKKAVE